MSKKVIVTCACQSDLLARALNLFLPHIKFIPFIPRQEKSDQKVIEIMSGMDTWLNEDPLPQVSSRVHALLEKERFREIKVPLIVSHVFHPDDDFVVTSSDGELFKGPLGNRHHSALILASYLANRPKDRVKELFCRKVFSKVGYLNLWNESLKILRDSFESRKLPFERFGLRLTRAGIFMHDPIHPTSTAICYFAQEIAESIFDGKNLNVEEILPLIPDELRENRVWPVYPEIAKELGVLGGGYRWWFPVRHIDSLDDFIDLSYKAYANSDVKNISAKKSLDPRIKEIVSQW